MLAGLTVAPEQRTGYQRTKFKLWVDADHDGCDTRKEVLIAEAIVAPRIKAGCTLSGGAWLSLYDRLRFTASSKLDIDHVVPLAEAWDSGAWRWTAARRQAFANDLGKSWVLIAVSAHSNRSKGDRDPAGWMPASASYTCRYLGGVGRYQGSLAPDRRPGREAGDRVLHVLSGHRSPGVSRTSKTATAKPKPSGVLATESRSICGGRAATPQGDW